MTLTRLIFNKKGELIDSNGNLVQAVPTGERRTITPYSTPELIKNRLTLSDSLERNRTRDDADAYTASIEMGSLSVIYYKIIKPEIKETN